MKVTSLFKVRWALKEAESLFNNKIHSVLSQMNYKGLSDWGRCCLHTGMPWKSFLWGFFLLGGNSVLFLNCLLSFFKSGRMGLHLVLAVILFSKGQKVPAGSTVTFASFPSESNIFFPQYLPLELKDVQSLSAILIRSHTLPCRRTTICPWNFVSQHIVNVKICCGH